MAHWGKYVQLLQRYANGDIVDTVGSSGTVRMDQRFGLPRMLVQASEHAYRERKFKGSNNAVVGYEIRQGDLYNYRVLHRHMIEGQ